MTVILYGELADSMGREVELDQVLTGETVGALRDALAERYPDFGTDLLSGRVRAFVNNAAVRDNHILTAGDTVALLPPVSGG